MTPCLPSPSHPAFPGPFALPTSPSLLAQPSLVLLPSLPLSPLPYPPALPQPSHLAFPGPLATPPFPIVMDYIFSWFYCIFTVFVGYFVSHVIYNVHRLVMWQVTWLCYLSFKWHVTVGQSCLVSMDNDDWLIRMLKIRSYSLMLCIRFYSAYLLYLGWHISL